MGEGGGCDITCWPADVKHYAMKKSKHTWISAVSLITGWTESS